MKYNDIIQILKTSINAIIDPMYLRNKFGESEIFQFTKNLDLNNNMDNSVYTKGESSNKEYNESIPMDDSNSYNDNESNVYYNKQKDTSSNPQGVIDSITQDITSVRLKQAIILSEIVGKPRCKTRRKRRF